MNIMYIIFILAILVIVVILGSILIREFMSRQQVTEGFNSDASFNNIFLLDQKYTAYDNLHNPYRHMYESLNFP